MVSCLANLVIPEKAKNLTLSEQKILSLTLYQTDMIKIMLWVKGQSFNNKFAFLWQPLIL